MFNCIPIKMVVHVEQTTTADGTPNATPEGDRVRDFCIHCPDYLDAGHYFDQQHAV